jgi:hypothetical protein
VGHSNPLDLELSVNGIFFDLEEEANREQLARANIKKRSAIANALAFLAPWTEVYSAGPIAGSGPLLSCFGKEDVGRVLPAFAIAGHPTLKVYLHYKRKLLHVVAIMLTTPA